MKFWISVALVLLSSIVTSCDPDDNNSSSESGSSYYDVIQINGKKMACFGAKAFITVASTWNNDSHDGVIRLECGPLPSTNDGNYDFDYTYEFFTSNEKDLSKGLDLKDVDGMSMSINLGESGPPQDL